MFDSMIMPFLMALRYLLLFYGIATLLVVFKIKGYEESIIFKKGTPDEQKVNVTKERKLIHFLVKIIFVLAIFIFIYFDLMALGNRIFLLGLATVTNIMIVMDMFFEYKKILSSDSLKQVLVKIFLIILTIAVPIIIRYVYLNPQNYNWQKIF